MRKELIVTAILVGVFGASASASPITGSDARKLLFRGAKTSLVLNPSAPMTDVEKGALETLVATNGFQYYGAMAYAPDEGLISESLQGAFNFHSVESASQAALAACNAANAAGGQPCIVAAQIVPRRYERRDFQLSQDATAAIEEYRAIREEKAMAISPSSGGFGLGQGGTAEADALVECNRTAPQRDCVIAVRN